MDSNEKTAREGTPEPNCRRKEHTQQQGKELELLVIRNSAIEKIVKMPGEEWQFFKAVQRQ